MWTILRSCLIVLVVLLSAHTSARADTIVVPPFLANAEGNGEGWASPCPSGGFRAQCLFPASDFSALPEDRRTFVRMALRPDHTVTSPRSAHFPNFELRLSTTTVSIPAGTTSWTFADNVGADETIVFSGDWDIYTDGSGPPHGFDYVLDFQIPFVYDPSQGNLLVEVLFDYASGVPWVDAHVFSPWDPHGVMVATSRSATRGEWKDPIAIVFQFDVVPEPSSVVYVVVFGIALTTRAWRRKRKA